MGVSNHKYPIETIITTGLATETKQDDIITELETQGDVLDDIKTNTDNLTSDPATATLQGTGNTSLASIDTKLDSLATEAKQDDNITALDSLLTELQAKADLDETQPVSAASLPLPSGASTSAKQDVIIGHVDGIESLLTTIDGVIDNIYTEQLAQGTVLDNIETAAEKYLTPVDFLDSGLFDSSSTNITSFSGTSVVGELAADVKEIEVIEDIGEYMALTNGSGDILAYLPLGGGRVKVNISSGMSIKLKSLTGSDITSGKIAINFLG